MVAPSTALERRHKVWPSWQPMQGAFLVDLGHGETPSCWDYSLDSAALAESYSGLSHMAWRLVPAIRASVSDQQDVAELMQYLVSRPLSKGFFVGIRLY